jgi:pimeloyl-ACP methyl ester carboxylesterase
LLARDYRVIRVDARGFGRSSIPAPGYHWSLEGFATDLIHLMDHLGIDKAHVVGETIGGTIALQCAYQFPDRLHTVTTATSPYKFRGIQSYLDYYNLVKERGVEAWVRQTADRRLEPGQSDPQHSAWYVQQMSQTAQHVVLETLAYLSTVDLTPILPQITTPALVLVGERSTMNTADRTRSLAELLPNGRLVEVPGTSGYVQHSAPAQCVAIWRDFVRSASWILPIIVAPMEPPFNAAHPRVCRERKRISISYNTMSTSKRVTIYTDGACLGNPGPGGYGVVLLYGDHRRELSGGYRRTTNNRMELTAAIKGLAALKKPCEVELFSDSEYVVNAVEKGWARRWRANGWYRSNKQLAENRDLW